MSQRVKIVGVAHSKLRNAIGAVGIEIDVDKHEIQVVMVKHWERNEINKIAPEIGNLFNKIEWENTIIDMQVGEHLIKSFRSTSDMPMRIIHIAKKVKDEKEIERVKTIDLVETVQFTLQLKLVHKILFPTRPSEAMQELEGQIALYSEHATEAGGIDYYAPGDEFDDLTKALIVAIFGARPFLNDDVEIIAGPITPKTAPTMEDVMAMESKSEGMSIF